MLAWGVTDEISGNLITHNRVSLVSNSPEVREVVPFVLADQRDETTIPPCEVIHDNVITKNDFRDPSLQLEVSPLVLWECNLINKNR